jgi:GTP-binding protein
MKKFADDVRNQFQFLDYAQIAFVSAKEGTRYRIHLNDGLYLLE